MGRISAWMRTNWITGNSRQNRSLQEFRVSAVAVRKGGNDAGRESKRKLLVTKDTYDSLKVHDTCYIASATSKDETVYYRKFDLDRLYMLPGKE